MILHPLDHANLPEFAQRMAAALWPEKKPYPQDCRAEVGREGEPCRICADATEQWAARVERVRKALEEVLAS